MNYLTHAIYWTIIVVTIYLAFGYAMEKEAEAEIRHSDFYANAFHEKTIIQGIVLLRSIKR